MSTDVIPQCPICGGIAFISISPSKNNEAILNYTVTCQNMCYSLTLANPETREAAFSMFMALGAYLKGDITTKGLLNGK